MFHTEKWFYDRTRKAVYRNKLSCSCTTCQKEKDVVGVYIKNRAHAYYLYVCQEEGIQYRDKK